MRQLWSTYPQIYDSQILINDEKSIKVASNKQQTFKVITIMLANLSDEMQCRPVLYDYSRKDYHDTAIRAKAWQEVAEAVGYYHSRV